MIKLKKKTKQTSKKEYNSNFKSEIKTLIKKMIKTIKANNKEAANKEFSYIVPKLDKLARKNIIHKNTAARQKKRLNKKLKIMNLAN